MLYHDSHLASHVRATLWWGHRPAPLHLLPQQVDRQARLEDALHPPGPHLQVQDRRAPPSGTFLAWHRPP